MFPLKYANQIWPNALVISSNAQNVKWLLSARRPTHVTTNQIAVLKISFFFYCGARKAVAFSVNSSIRRVNEESTNLNRKICSNFLGKLNERTCWCEAKNVHLWRWWNTMVIDFENGIIFSSNMLQQINVKLSRMKWNEMRFKISLENYHFVNEYKAQLIPANKRRRVFFKQNVVHTALFRSRSISISFIKNRNSNHGKYEKNRNFIAKYFVVRNKRFSAKYLRKIHENASNTFTSMAFKTFSEKQTIV